MSKLNWRQSEMKARKKFFRDMLQKPSNLLKHATYDKLFKKIADELTEQHFLYVLMCVNSDVTERELFGKFTILGNVAADSTTKPFYTKLLAQTIHGLATNLNITPDKLLGEIAVEIADLDSKIIELGRLKA